MSNASTISPAAAIADHANALAEAVTRRHYERRPELLERFGERGRAKCLQDANYHLSYLIEAVEAGERTLFSDYVAWAKVMLAGRGIPASDLADNLAIMRDCVAEILLPNEARVVCSFIDHGLARVDSSPAEVRTFIDSEGPISEFAAEYLELLLAGRRSDASRLILDAVQKGTTVRDIYLRVFQPVQHEIGRLWQENRLSVAQEHYCTAATQMVMSQLYPYLFNSERIGRTMVAASVSGDLHEIGVRMVADFFEMEGWDTFYLGANSPASDILKLLAERRVDLLVVSATMTFHLRAVRDLIGAVRSAHREGTPKIMVGGYPFNIAPQLWRQVGADGYSVSALDAIKTARELIDQSE